VSPYPALPSLASSVSKHHACSQSLHHPFLFLFWEEDLSGRGKYTKEEPAQPVGKTTHSLLQSEGEIQKRRNPQAHAGFKEFQTSSEEQPANQDQDLRVPIQRLLVSANLDSNSWPPWEDARIAGCSPNVPHVFRPHS
jgi:hypothetical protein